MASVGANECSDCLACSSVEIQRARGKCFHTHDNFSPSCQDAFLGLDLRSFISESIFLQQMHLSFTLGQENESIIVSEVVMI